MITMRHTTTIEQTIGQHADGTRYVRTVDIITDASDLGYTGQDTEWWEDYTQRYHRAAVALAALPPEQRDEAISQIADIAPEAVSAPDVMMTVVQSVQEVAR
jgi:hypothetical protein